MPILMKLFEMIDTKLVPAFAWLKEHAIDPVVEAVMRNKDAFMGLWEILKTYVVPILTGAFATALVVVGKVAAGIVDVIGNVAGAITTVVNGAIAGINMLIKAYNAIPLLPNIPTIPTVSAPKITVPKVTVPSVSGSGGGGGSTFTSGSSGGSTGGSGASGAATVIATTAKTLTPSELSAIPVSGSAANTAGAAILNANPNVNIYVQGPSIIDEQGFTNSIIQAFNNGTYRGTAGAGMLAGL